MTVKKMLLFAVFTSPVLVAKELVSFVVSTSHVIFVSTRLGLLVLFYSQHSRLVATRIMTFTV